MVCIYTSLSRHLLRWNLQMRNSLWIVPFIMNSLHMCSIPVFKEITQMQRLFPHFSCLTKTCTFHSLGTKKTQCTYEQHAVIWMVYLLHWVSVEYSPGIKLLILLHPTEETLTPKGPWSSLLIGSQEQQLTASLCAQYRIHPIQEFHIFFNCSDSLYFPPITLFYHLSFFLLFFPWLSLLIGILFPHLFWSFFLLLCQLEFKKSSVFPIFFPGL